MKSKKSSLAIFVSAIFLFSCRPAPIPNKEADEYGKDSIIVLQEFSDTKDFDENEFGQKAWVKEDSLGYALIMKTDDFDKKDSENILGKIMCGTVIHCKTIMSPRSPKEYGYAIVLKDKGSRRGIGYIRQADVFNSYFQFKQDSFCNFAGNRKLQEDTTGPDCNKNEMFLTGVYDGKNVQVENPPLCDGLGYCIYEVRVNDRVTTDEIGHENFQIDLSLCNLAKGDPLEIKIFHKSCCSPKILNPEVLGKDYSISRK
jgi:hypothetical protein